MKDYMKVMEENDTITITIKRYDDIYKMIKSIDTKEYTKDNIGELIKLLSRECCLSIIQRDLVQISEHKMGIIYYILIPKEFEERHNHKLVYSTEHNIVIKVTSNEELVSKNIFYFHDKNIDLIGRKYIIEKYNKRYTYY